MRLSCVPRFGVVGVWRNPTVGNPQRFPHAAVAYFKHGGHILLTIGVLASKADY